MTVQRRDSSADAAELARWREKAARNRETVGQLVALLARAADLVAQLDNEDR